MTTLTPIRHAFRLASNEAFFASVHDSLDRKLAVFGYSERDAFALHLALTEALSNAVQHGNRSDRNRHVSVEITVDNRRASVSVEDEGDGFCVSAVADPTLAECITLPRGRGIFLMRSFMDSVRYNAEGNSVTMIRNRSRA